MYNKLKAVIEIIKKVFSILSRDQKKKSLVAFGTIVLSSLLELIGVTVILPFIMAIMDMDAFMQNQYVRCFLRLFHIENISAPKFFVLIGILIVFVYVIKNICLIWARYVQHAYQLEVQRETSVLMMRSYYKRPYEYFANTNSAEILRGIGTDVNGFSNVIGELFNCLSESLTLLLIAVFVLSTDFMTSISLVAVVLIAFMVILYACKNTIAKAGIKSREITKQYTMWAYQAINGVKEIFVMKRKRFFLDKYEKIFREKNDTEKRYKLATLIPEKAIEILIVAALIVIICVRILRGDTAESYIPQLGTLAVACFRLMPSMNKITSGISQIIYFEPSLNAVYNNITDARRYANQNYGLIGQEDERDTERITFEKELCMEDISWRYINGEKNVLEHLSIKIAKGESIALIGESGAGKSTLADIIMGLLQPQKGVIKVDGKVINGNHFFGPDIIGYVPQNVYLIDDTIRNNVAFGVPPEEIKDEAIWHALKQSKLDEYVKRLPNGLETVVGERGVRFSGGQRQRIAIARTMYYDPEILVLDEATSALDNETEREVMESIDALQGKKTLIIIAHRLTTIQKCHRVYEVVNGGLVERDKSEVK